MYRCIKAASSDEQDTRFDDSMSNLKDDFSYLMDTFDKMNREGNAEQALPVIDYVSQCVNEAIATGHQGFDSNEE